MSCYKPLKAFQRAPGEKPVFVSGDRDLAKWQLCYNDQRSYPSRAILVPCGQCIGCRMSYAREWAVRCLLESKDHSSGSCFFGTLTYSDDCLPLSYACDPDTGQVLYETHTLVLSDLQNFWKRLRENLERRVPGCRIRYYYSGEYGSKSQRPHYHFILFGFPELPGDFYVSDQCKASDGGILLESHLINKAWPFGLAVLGELTFDSAAYTAGYMLKKHKGKDSIYYDIHGLLPEFSGGSRRPGIARSYYEEHYGDMYEYDSVGFSMNGQHYTPRPPKYFDRLYAVNHAEDLLRIKDVRMRDCIVTRKLLLSRTSLTEEQLNAIALEKARNFSLTL